MEGMAVRVRVLNGGWGLTKSVPNEKINKKDAALWGT